MQEAPLTLWMMLREPFGFSDPLLSIYDELPDRLFLIAFSNAVHSSSFSKPTSAVERTELIWTLGPTIGISPARAWPASWPRPIAARGGSPVASINRS